MNLRRVFDFSVRQILADSIFAHSSFAAFRISTRCLKTLTSIEIQSHNNIPETRFFNNSSKPYARWWWLGGPYSKKEISRQLDWIESKGFGGVEVSWITPIWEGLENIDYDEMPTWLDEEWTDLLVHTKAYANKIGLGVDLTFGAAWPFGGSYVSKQHAAKTFDGLDGQTLWAGWELKDKGQGPILDHLSAEALQAYSAHQAPAFRPILDESGCSGLFCDSLEIHTQALWSPKLWDLFEERFGYRLEPFYNDFVAYPDVAYDYWKLIAEVMEKEFYEEFTTISNQLGGYSRVQAHGSPTDLLTSYALADVPETEAILFNPTFSRIPASAAILASKPVVSSETFTCIYGFCSQHNLYPETLWKRDQAADLKLLADSIFAQGVNQIVWHGMPYQPEGTDHRFYASVHVGEGSLLTSELAHLNDYMERVSQLMRLGKTYTNLAVYLPWEDAVYKGKFDYGTPRVPGSAHHWEMRDATPSEEARGFAPTWVSLNYLKKASVLDGDIQINKVYFKALMIDVERLDFESIKEILRLAKAGGKIVLKQLPTQPGHGKSDDYQSTFEELIKLPNVDTTLKRAGIVPLLEGENLPDYWVRETEEKLYMFFAHPKSKEVSYPMTYGQSLTRKPVTRDVNIYIGKRKKKMRLVFRPYQSIVLEVDKSKGRVSNVDIAYNPPQPTLDQ